MLPIHHLSSEQVERAKNGAVIIFPTETIYGIGCNAWFDGSIGRIFKIKGRAEGQPPPLLIHSTAQMNVLATHLTPLAAALMESYWPGDLTLILPAHPNLSPLLSGLSADYKTRTVGIRQTAHPISRALCEQIDAPLIATSANFSGATGRAAAPQSLHDIPMNFREQADIIIDGGMVRGMPSTIVDCVSIPPRILRAGAIELSNADLENYD